ncbi:MAG TPA: ATP-binding protein [Methylomirabilota bacterium]|nr:ATP-binding protein [Methylomirabilota bacterium]
MRLKQRTKLTLVITGLVLLVVVVLSGVFVLRLTEQVLTQTNDHARIVAEQIFNQAKRALEEAARQGLRPTTGSAEDIHDYVRHAFEVNPSLHAEMDAALGYSVAIDEVTIADADGMALVSSNPALPGTFIPRRALFVQLLQWNFFSKMRAIYGRQQPFEVDYAFTMSGKPYGDVRVRISSAFLRKELSPDLRSAAGIVAVALVISTLLAAAVSGAALRPLAAISAQLDRISAGQFDAPVPPAGPAADTDEVSQVTRKITQVGQQLRGVHEIFSSLRENLDQVMAGLEDGLLLFTRDSRAVMVSPAAGKLLGAPSREFLGRRVEDIFPAGHPLRAALQLDDSQMLQEGAAEAELETPEGRKRVGVTVQAIQEDGERMGALLTLRDLDSIENINTQLQVSERLAALGRITAGVAHEVKNPLNSMRLWLENLKESLPREQDTAREAVRILDKEIDRLDTVVKRFLDFTRPMEVRLEPTQLAQLLQEVLEVARPQLQRANIRVAQLLPIDVPEVYVDRALLKQAVLNLVLNGVEAMPSGGQLRLVLSRRGEMAEICVGDTGPGIPPENRQKIFQLFFTTRPGGSGIGLASTFRIVQLLNGSIDFTSEVGRGTTFLIELPLAS